MAGGWRVMPVGLDRQVVANIFIARQGVCAE